MRYNHLSPSKDRIARGIKSGGRDALKKQVENAFLIGVPIVGSLLAISHVTTFGITWIDITSFIFFYVLTGIGVAMGLHRYFSHRSFETSTAFALLLAALGSMAFQGSIERWVVDHCRHHANTDIKGDVHSPCFDSCGNQLSGLKGFIHAHIGWMFDSATTDKDVFGGALIKDPVVQLFSKTYYVWLGMALLLPYLYGYAIGGPEAAWSSMLIGGFLKTSILHNVIWLVNSIGHSRGSADFLQPNQSRNNKWLAVLTFGEGWHNNHHKYPRSYRQGLLPEQVDTIAWLLELLERCNIIWNVNRVPPPPSS